MKLAVGILSVLALVHHGDAGIDTCPEQLECVDFTITKNNPAQACLGCDYTICLKLNLGKGGCTKTGTVSHTCLKPSTSCITDGSCACIFRDCSTEKGDIPDGYEQCQIVPAGGTATFLLKDSSSCSGGVDATATVDGLDGTIQASCAPSSGGAAPECSKPNKNVDSCTGNNVGVECIWTVTAPDDSSCDVPCTPSEESCCPEPAGTCTEAECEAEGIDCTPPPMPWKCKVVCEMEEEDRTCEPVELPARRLSEAERRSLQETAAKVEKPHLLRF